MCDSAIDPTSLVESAANIVEQRRLAAALLQSFSTRATYCNASPDPVWIKVLQHSDAGIRRCAILWLGGSNTITPIEWLFRALEAESNEDCIEAILASIHSLILRNDTDKNAALHPAVESLVVYFRHRNCRIVAAATALVASIDGTLVAECLAAISDSLDCCLEAREADSLRLVEAIGSIGAYCSGLRKATYSPFILVRTYAAMWMIRLGVQDDHVRKVITEAENALQRENVDTRIRTGLESFLRDAH